MGRQRRARRRPNNSGEQNSNQSNQGQKPGVSGRSRRRKRNSGRNQVRKKKSHGETGRKSPVDPVPLQPIHKITSASPVGTGNNPLATNFLEKGHSAALKRPLFYKVIFYDSFKAAKQDSQKIKESCDGCDQLNVVIKAEGNMKDPEILDIDEKVKLFAGEAWTLIHQRRSEEGWYDAAQ